MLTDEQIRVLLDVPEIRGIAEELLERLSAELAAADRRRVVRRIDSIAGGLSDELRADLELDGGLSVAFDSSRLDGRQ